MNGNHSQLQDFTRKTLIAVSIAGAGWLAVTIVVSTFPLLLLIFAGILLGVFMRSTSHFVAKYTPIPVSVTLIILWLLLALIIIVIPWQFGPVMANDLDNLFKEIPKSIDRLRHWAGNWDWARQLLDRVTSKDSGFTAAALGQVLGIFSTLVGALSGLLLILVLGLYFSAKPEIYINGLVKLIPHSRREHGREVLAVAGHTLFGWVLSRMVSMMVVGVLTYLGLLALGVPQALILAVVAGLFTFVPYLGPILSVVPALLIALGQYPMLALYVIILYGGVQLAESYFITPYVQWRFISMPPALVLSAQVLMGIGTGIFGVVLAGPLVVVLRVLAELLYVRDALHDEKVPLNPRQ